MIEELLLENEMNLILDSLNGIDFEQSLILGVERQQLILEIEDCIELGKLDVKWKVDTGKFIRKLKELSDKETCEVIKYAYEFWKRDMDETLKQNLNDKEIKTMIREKNINNIAKSEEEAINQLPACILYDAKYKKQEMIIALNRLYQNEKENLKGLFTLGEALLIITAFNGFLYTPWRDDKEVLLMMIEGAIIYEYMPDNKYSVDDEKMLEKINKLSSFECFAVIRMAYDFYEKRKGSLISDKLIKEIFGIE